MDVALPAPRREVLRALLIVVAAVAGLWMAHRLIRIFVVLMLAMLLAYLMAPVVTLAQSPFPFRGRPRRLSRAAAMVVVYLLFAGGAAGGAALIWPAAARQLDSAIVSAPGYAASFQKWERGWTKYYERLRIPADFRRTIDDSASRAGDSALAYGRGALMGAIGLAEYVPWVVLIPVLAFFLLKDAAVIRRTVLTALPHRVQLRGHRLFEELSATLAAYMRAQLIACALIGVLCGAGLALLGNPYPIWFGVLAAVLEFIPLVGPLVLAVLAVTAAAFQSPAAAAWTALFLLVVRVAQDYVIYPRLIGHDIHLHPLIVILAVVAGAELGGGTGIFVAIPVIALLTVLGRHWHGWRAEGIEAARVEAVSAEP
jgi:predicted PurR-regulated permease PerM